MPRLLPQFARLLLAAPLITAAMAAAPAFADDAAASDPQKTGRALVERFFDLLSKDSPSEGLDAFLSPAFQICRADGSFANKQEYLANPAKVERFTIADDGFRAYRDGPALTVRFAIDVEEQIDGGEVAAMQAMRSGTFLQEGGRWRLLSWCNFNPTTPAAAGNAAALPTFDEILARNLESLGGKAAIEAVRHVTIDASMQMPAMGIRGEMTSRMSLPDRSISQTEMPGIGRIVEGLNGEIGWSIDPIRGPSLAEPQEVAQRQLLSRLANNLGDPRDLFETVEVLGVAEFAGEPCYEVRLASKDGLAYTILYRVKDGLTHGMRMTMKSSLGDLPVEVAVGEYRRFGDLLWPTRTTTRVMGQEQTLVIEQVSFDPIDPAVFELPPAIKALAGAGEAPAAKEGEGESPPAEQPRRRRRPAATPPQP